MQSVKGPHCHLRPACPGPGSSPTSCPDVVPAVFSPHDSTFPLYQSIHWKDWCWRWSSNTLATWYEELTRWKRPWCWERLKAKGGEGREDEMVGWHHQLNGREFCTNSGRWWRTGRAGVLQSMGLQRVGYDRSTEQQLEYSQQYDSNMLLFLQFPTPNNNNNNNKNYPWLTLISRFCLIPPLVKELSALISTSSIMATRLFLHRLSREAALGHWLPGSSPAVFLNP